MKYFEELKRAVNLEREEEKRAAIEEIRRLSGEKREKLGRAVLGVKGSYQGRDLGGFYVVKFGRSKPIDTEIDVGDVVLISKGNPLKSDLTGTVVSKTSRSISVALSVSPPKWVISKGLRIDLFFNDITFKRMEKAIEIVEGSEKASWIRDIVLGNFKAEIGEIDIDFSDTDLNEFQRMAVSKAVGSRVFLVHGPPGTGKTRTLTETIVQLVKLGRRVAVSADSNLAADNLLEMLVKRNVDVLRIGHPARVEKKLLEHTLSYVVQSSEDYGRVEELRMEAQRLMEERDKFVKPSPRYRRGMTDEEILSIAKTGRNFRGVPSTIISSMARWIEMNRKVSFLLDRARDLEERIVKFVLSKARVVVGTNSSFGMDYMEDEEFDVLVHDEATQSTEPSSYIPLVLSKSLVMAGDHKQLPPTVVSLKAKEILSRTLFEKLIERYPELSEILRVQYRMNEKIMRFPSEKFYNGKLIAHESVKNRTLSAIGIKAHPSATDLSKVLDPESPLALIDTSKNPKRWERKRKGSTSRENPLEAEIVRDLVGGLISMGLGKDEIGVITPYDDQVDLLKDLLPDGIKTSTVDAFQGKEKEVIIISFVRSNTEGELGFLEDLRRLNVSITRAKSKLILVGDFETLSNNPVYRDLRSYVGKNGEVLFV